MIGPLICSIIGKAVNGSSGVLLEAEQQLVLKHWFEELQPVFD